MKNTITKQMTLVLVGAALIQSAPNWVSNTAYQVQVAAHEDGSTTLSSRRELRSGKTSFSREGIEGYTNKNSSFTFEVQGSPEMIYGEVDSAEINYDNAEEFCPTTKNIARYKFQKGNESKTVTLKPTQIFKESESLGRFFEIEVEGAKKVKKRDLRTEFKIIRNARKCERIEDDKAPTTRYYFDARTDSAEGRHCNTQPGVSGFTTSEDEMRQQMEEATKTINDCMLKEAVRLAEEKVLEKYQKEIDTCQVRLVDEENPLAGIIHFDKNRSRITAAPVMPYSSAQSFQYQSSAPSMMYSSRNPFQMSRYGSSMIDEDSYDIDNSLVSQAQCFVEQLEYSESPSKTKSAFTKFLNMLEAMIKHPSKQDTDEAVAALDAINETGLEGRFGARAAALTEYVVGRDRIADVFNKFCSSKNGVAVCPMEVQQQLAGYCIPNYSIGQLECDGGLLGYTQNIFDQLGREEGFRGNKQMFNSYMGQLVREVQVVINDPNAYDKFVNPGGGPIINPSEIAGLNEIGRSSNNGIVLSSDARNLRSGGTSVPTSLQSFAGAQQPTMSVAPSKN